MKRKISKTEFTIKNMPHNRIQVFFDIIKNRSSMLLLLGIFLFIFSIPLMLIEYFSNVAVSNLDANVEYNEIAILIHSQNFLIIIGLIIFSIGLAGACKIIRMLIWQEGIIFISDFKNGIKSNAKGFMLTAAIVGILNFLLGVIIYEQEINQFAFLAIIVVIIFYLPTVVFTLNQTVIYNLTYLAKTKNSFLLAWRNWYTSIPVTILNLGIIFLFLIPDSTTYVILTFLIPIIVAPLLTLFTMLYTDTIFDKYINKGNFDEIIDKGIYRNGTN